MPPIDRDAAPPPGDPSRDFLQRTLLVLGLVALLVALALLLWNAAEIFLLGFAGILFALFLNTPAHQLSRRTPLPHGWALALVVTVLVALVVVGAWLTGPRLVEQATRLTGEIPSGVRQIRDRLQEWPAGAWLLERVPARGEGLELSGFNVVSRVTGTASTLWDVAAKVVYVLFLGLFFAAAPRSYRDGVARLVPKPRQARAREVLDELGRTLQGWLVGQVVAMLLVGLLTGAGLWIIGVPLALILGIIAGLAEFVPIVGPLLAFVPAVLLAFGQGAEQALWVLGLYLVIQQVEGNVIQPLVQRRAVDLPPVLTITAVFVGGAAFGPTGLLVATPLMAVVVVLVKMLYLHEVLHEHVELPGGKEEG